MLLRCCQYVYYKVKDSFPGKITDRAVLGLKRHEQSSVYRRE